MSSRANNLPVLGFCSLFLEGCAWLLYWSCIAISRQTVHTTLNRRYTVTTALLHSVTISYFHCSSRMALSVDFTIRGLALWYWHKSVFLRSSLKVTHSERVCRGSCPGCSEERTSNVAQVPTTLQEQGRIGECCKSSCH